MEPKIKMIKHDAVIKIEIGTAFVKKIQQLLFFIANDKTKEQLEEYRKLVEEKKDLPEEWMQHLYTISILISEVETQADKQGFTYDIDKVEDIPTDDVITEEGN